MPQRISLQKYVFENNLSQFIHSIGKGNKHEKIILDFNKIEYWIPAATVGLLTKIKSWEKAGKKVVFENCKKSNAFEYFQRINFFDFCGLNFVESFNRYDPEDRFMPIKGIGRSGVDYTHDTDQVASQAANCLAPNESKYYDEVDILDYNEDQTGLYDYVEYCVSEMTRNVLNHSKAKGFIATQYAETKDIIRLAIADYGIGIRESFRNTKYWYEGMDDVEAIHKALEPEVSSKSSRQPGGYSNNAGVGLTLLRNLAEKFDGDFTLVTDTGFVNLDKEIHILESKHYNGTLCSISFKRSKAGTFAQVFREIKDEMRLLDQSEKVKPNFL